MHNLPKYLITFELNLWRNGISSWGAKFVSDMFAFLPSQMNEFSLNLGFIKL